MKEFKVVTLCGSTKFKDDFIREQKRLTLEGYIVISVGLFGHSGDDEVWTEGTKEMLDENKPKESMKAVFSIPRAPPARTQARNNSSSMGRR